MSVSESLLRPLFGDPAVDAAFDDRARLQAMLDVEAALARAQARCGVIPASAVAPIVSACDAARYDLPTLGAATALAGNPAIPLVKALTAQVAAADEDAARWVHWGATSQDIIDSGAVLQLRAALDHVEAQLDALCAALAALAQRERDTGLPGRTLLQQAVPVTFGLKAAGWLDALQRSRRRLQALRKDALVLQFGGAAGTLAALQSQGLAVAEALAAELRLPLPSLPWHAARDRIGEIGAAFALLAGSLGKIGRDVALLMQSEVAEAFEPAAAGKGGSSAMPHKRNPVGCVVAIAAATRAPGLLATLFAALPQEHERAVGGWHAEWETLPELVRLSAGSLAQVRVLIEGLELDRARMAAHLDSHGGLLYAEAVAVTLATHLGKAAAHALVETAVRRALAAQQHLRAVLAEDPQVTAVLAPTQLDALFASDSWRGMATVWIERVLAAQARA
ncbi:3-carboxy-cis,cis-muconate cycloisomerase [Xanthomonas sp. NCPPB 1128]|uniref:3-carboxy-cis,cis-muconate cycloisomerase n=1 Tax=Xanthomonas sp. NCPPB 1128 TaxID=1775876 RepID=UPI00065AA4FD|nr:3-carboxy-cis,cis-muconate cycloisomerase [Xanthomonas sp. NCPPB 1128]KMM75540.1 3-carboxy-cis,cis-muconate cycloisomerase [Xanthomonas sp. NCPPB 1128]